MDLLLLFKAAIMGLVEGITEFLPISSTGHLILSGQLLDFWTVEKRDMFAVAVQIGAIAAVIYEYWGKLWGALIGAMKGQEQGRRLSLNLIIASIPIVIIGLTFGDVVKAYLFNAITVAIALIVGGFIILVLDFLGWLSAFVQFSAVRSKFVQRALAGIEYKKALCF